MNNAFASAGITAGQLNAVVKNLMHRMGITNPIKAVRYFNSGEWTVVSVNHYWDEEDNVIYFSVTSDGTTGPEWIKRLEKGGLLLTDHVRGVLRSSDFKPTSGTTTKIAVLKGVLFESRECSTKNIYSEASDRNLTKPNAEVACLIREKLTDEEIEKMGLWHLMTMHEPITYSDDQPYPFLLSADRNGDGDWLNAYRVNTDQQKWNISFGFAFAVSQVNSKS